jgi:hypothetical protein
MAPTERSPISGSGLEPTRIEGPQELTGGAIGEQIGDGNAGGGAEGETHHAVAGGDGEIAIVLQQANDWQVVLDTSQGNGISNVVLPGGKDAEIPGCAMLMATAR